MMRPTNFFGRLRSNAVSLFQTNSVLHWSAPDFSVLRDVHSKPLLSKRQKKSWVSRSTGKSSSTSAFKLGSFSIFVNQTLIVRNKWTYLSFPRMEKVKTEN